MEKYIKGKYKSDIFRSEKGYVIGIFKISETNFEEIEDYINHTITITGYFYDLNENDNYILKGELVEHPKYGLQFAVKESEKLKPTDKDGIVEFLSSDLFPGVGEKMAIKIVDVLGVDTINLILEDKNNLTKVPKLSNKKIDQIYNILTNYENSHKTIVYLCDLGFSSGEALNIYNIYRNKTLDVLNENIYEYIEDVENISFLKIDLIRNKLELKNDDERRIKACILYVMRTLTYQNGDTYLTFEIIYNEVLKYLNIGITESNFASYLDELKYNNKIVIDEAKIYLEEIFKAEINISSRVKDLIKASKKKYKNLKAYLDEIEVVNNIKYNSKQKEAIKLGLTNGISIITGGPGTGKTTIIKAIVELYQTLNNLNYEQLINEMTLLAPTGRAAKRLSESTNLPAMTIHRFLKWHKETNSFEVNEYNKNFSKIIIVDEVSMVDINLLDSLFKGLTRDIQLVLVGDYHQLPSVGPGLILKDLIESTTIETVSLDLFYRQGKNSFIPVLADDIKSGRSDQINAKVNDYVFLECNRQMIRESIKKISQQLMEKGVSLNDLQLLAPMYKGMNGIDVLNKDMQNIFNPKAPDKAEIVVGESTYRVNDKVIELVNMPDENIYNGDIGYIADIIPATMSDSKKNEIVVNYDGNYVTYLPKDYNKIKLAYIISIHKSQGSEFPIVIMPMSLEYNKMLYRKLIYTGVTRAKKKLIILGESDAFRYSINNTNEYVRKTALIERLKI
ncbi:MAG: ATP-dependent RecD-like DNA helicase [Bacilli bacterium]|nr:ATP-dependent RecD-like DNA helicase [Bacilli bacterium]